VCGGGGYESGGGGVETVSWGQGGEVLLWFSVSTLRPVFFFWGVSWWWVLGWVLGA